MTLRFNADAKTRTKTLVTKNAIRMHFFVTFSRKNKPLCAKLQAEHGSHEWCNCKSRCVGRPKQSRHGLT